MERIENRMNRRTKIGLWVRIVCIAYALVLGTGGSSSIADDYARVTGPCRLLFPRDHGDHPRHRTEWWYYTGNVAGPYGRRFGYQFTIFRVRLRPPEEEALLPDPSSKWRTAQLFIGHGAVSDMTRKHHFQAEIMSRGALDLAGVTRVDNGVTVFLKQWQVTIGAHRHHIRADTGHFSLALNLEPQKAPVLHGDHGYSRKGSTPERASCYYSLTRLATEGVITVNGTPCPVKGLSWMDHEYSTAPLEPGLSGWDWFSLQLSDNTELMFFVLRRKQGGAHPASSGTFVDAEGRAHHLASTALSIHAMYTWQSPTTQATYPVTWVLEIPSRQLQLKVTANLEDQEMTTSRSSGVDYWKGSVSVMGTVGGRPVSGVGYVELTGYGKAFDAPM